MRRYSISSSNTSSTLLLSPVSSNMGSTFTLTLISLPKAYMLFLDICTANSAPASIKSWASWQIISEFKGTVHRSTWAGHGNTETPLAARAARGLQSSHGTGAYLLSHACKEQDLNKIFTPEKNKFWNKHWTQTLKRERKSKIEAQLLFLKTLLEWVTTIHIQRRYCFFQRPVVLRILVKKAICRWAQEKRNHLLWV